MPLLSLGLKLRQEQIIEMKEVGFGCHQVYLLILAWQRIGVFFLEVDQIILSKKLSFNWPAAQSRYCDVDIAAFARLALVTPNTYFVRYPNHELLPKIEELSAKSSTALLLGKMGEVLARLQVSSS